MLNDTGSSTRAVAVTPTNGTDIPVPLRLYIGGAGNLAVYMSDEDTPDTVVVFSGLTAGTVLRIAPRQVRSTLTTATLIVALY